MADESNLVSNILGLGEDRMGEVIGQLLANERFAATLQNAVTSSVQAKRSVDRTVSRLYGMANVPTLEDFEQLREKLDEVEALLGAVQAKADLLVKPKAKKKTAKKKKKKSA